METFIFGSLSCEYELLRQERKTLSLTVRPDLSVYLKAPHDVDRDRIELFLKRKWFWLQEQIRFFEKFQRKSSKKEYVSGESFWYLGRQYKLIIQNSYEDKIVIQRGRMIFMTSMPYTDLRFRRNVLNRWYVARAREVFEERYNEAAKIFGYDKLPRLVIKPMDRRWGSFTSKRSIILNPLLVRAPRDCIDYVIAHELCHMVHRRHNKAFYDLLESRIPDWRRLKDKLEMSRK